MTQGSAKSSNSSTQDVQKPKANWGMRITIAVVLVVVALIAYWILSTFLPIWWANTISQQVGGNVGGGILLGLIYGFVFTFLPLLVLWQARHKKISWAWKGILAIIAVLLSSPNLLTLGIMIGTTETAHNAQRIFGTQATWFPQWTMIGAIIAAALFVVVMIWSLMWSKRGRDIRKLKEEKKAAEHDRDELRANSENRHEVSSDSNAPVNPVADSNRTEEPPAGSRNVEL